MVCIIEHLSDFHLCGDLDDHLQLRAWNASLEHLLLLLFEEVELYDDLFFGFPRCVKIVLQGIFVLGGDLGAYVVL